MHRILASLGLLMALLSCRLGDTIARTVPVEPFLVPGAQNVGITALKWNEWRLSYWAPGSPTTWYTDVAHQLEAQHWTSLDRVEYGSLTRTYSRASSFGSGEVWEWAYLYFDPLRPHDVQIRVRRWFAIPWLQHRLRP